MAQPAEAPAASPAFAAAMTRTDWAAARRDPDAMPRASRLRGFYAQQNELIGRYAAVDAGAAVRQDGATAPRAGVEMHASRTARHVKSAIYASFAANVALLVIKVVAAVSSGSLAVIASVIDSALDLISGAVVFFAARASARRDPVRFPVGKARLEPLAIIVFATAMGMASLQLIVESVQTLATGVAEGGIKLRVGPSTYGTLAAVIGVKAVLAVICTALGDVSPSVAALALDHRNDVVTNACSLTAVLVGFYFPAAWFLDASTAILIAIIIIVSWARTGRGAMPFFAAKLGVLPHRSRPRAEHIRNLTGTVADPEVLSELLYTVLTHDPRIAAVESLRAYHHGTRLLVECDIVLERRMPLEEAHAIGESLQKRLEAHEDVERAFVHLDIDFSHHPGDEHVPP